MHTTGLEMFNEEHMGKLVLKTRVVSCLVSSYKHKHGPELRIAYTTLVLHHHMPFQWHSTDNKLLFVIIHGMNFKH